MMRRKLPSIVTTVQALAVLAGACTDVGLVDVGDRMPSAAEICREDQFGCVRVNPEKPIRLAVVTPLSSPRRSLALAMKLAVELRRPLLGRHIVLTKRDDGCASLGLPPAEGLASDPTIAAVIGAECPSQTAVSAQVLSEHGIVFVSTSSTNPGLTGPVRHAPFFLRTTHNDRVQGTAMATFAREQLGLPTAATVHKSGSSHRSLAALFAAEFVRRGGRIVYREAYRGRTTDPGRLLARIQQQSPEFLFAPVTSSDAALLARRIGQLEGMRASVLGSAYGPYTPDWPDAAVPTIGGVYVSAPDPRPQDPRFDSEFIPQYEQRFGKPDSGWPSYFLANAFDATNMVLDAIEEVAIQEKGVLYIPRTALRDQMFATRDFPGLSGTLTCDAYGDCNHSTPVVIYQVRNGAYLKVWTWRPVS